MKKINLIFAIIIISLILHSCNQNNSKSKKNIVRKNIISNPKLFINDENMESKTFIKGKVHNWITDTVYITTLPYHSPYSNKTFYQKISKDSTFQFDFNKIDQPVIIQLTSTKAAIDRNINNLLFDNLTDKHYYGQCEKFNTYQLTTYLLEPNDSILVELNFNSWIEKLSDKKAKYLKSLGVNILDNNTVRDYGKTGIKFLNHEKTSLEYYQKWFTIDDEFDSKIELSKNVEDAYNKVYELKEKLLSDLQQEKSNITPFLYDHLKSYIEFGARKEFLKNLILKNKDYLKGQVKGEITEFLEINKNDISPATFFCDQYNDYLEFYLTYKINKEKESNATYYEFNKEKFDFVIKEFPEKSQYSYLANQLLHQENLIDNKTLSIKLVENYPKGNLNEKLKEKFQ